MNKGMITVRLKSELSVPEKQACLEGQRVNLDSSQCLVVRILLSWGRGCSSRFSENLHMCWVYNPGKTKRSRIK